MEIFAFHHSVNYKIRSVIFNNVVVYVFCQRVRKMTVNELIEKLKTFNQDLRVVTPGFDEFDLEDVETVQLVNVVFHDEKERFHGGRHKESKGGVQTVKIDWQ